MVEVRTPSLVTGTEEWARIAPSYVAEALKGIMGDLSPLPVLCHDFIQHQVWRLVGESSWETFCVNVLGTTPELLQNLLVLLQQLQPALQGQQPVVNPDLTQGVPAATEILRRLAEATRCLEEATLSVASLEAEQTRLWGCLQRVAERSQNSAVLPRENPIPQAGKADQGPSQADQEDEQDPPPQAQEDPDQGGESGESSREAAKVRRPHGTVIPAILAFVREHPTGVSATQIQNALHTGNTVPYDLAKKGVLIKVGGLFQLPLPSP